MIKINQKKFNNIINYKNYSIVTDGKISSIDTNIIKEIKHGKNYFYTFDKDKKEARELLNIHSNIINEILNNIELNDVAKAFKKDNCYLDLFYPHISNYNFLRLDITSFFHSIKTDDIRTIFEIYFMDEYLDDSNQQLLVDSFIQLITLKIDNTFDNKRFVNKSILPMGFKTSPAISNIIFRQLDIMIQKFCLYNNIIYTRYADDLLFSSSKKNTYVHSDNFINEISIFLATMDFKINDNKTIKARHTISLNGYIIQSEYNNTLVRPEIRISQKKTKIIYKLIYFFKEKGYKPKVILYKLFKYDRITSNFNDQLFNKVSGYRAYLLSLIKFNKTYNCMSLERKDIYISLVNDLEYILEELEKLN